VVVDPSGNLYIADSFNSRVRVVTSDGTIGTVAGDRWHGYYGDGGPATAALLRFPSGLALDAVGNLYIADADNSRIRVLVPVPEQVSPDEPPSINAAAAVSKTAFGAFTSALTFTPSGARASQTPDTVVRN
jgi:sugar lactone lactonase YvrE